MFSEKNKNKIKNKLNSGTIILFGLLQNANVPVNLVAVTMDTLARDTNKAQFTSNLICNYFSADKDNSLVSFTKTLDEIQQLSKAKVKLN